MPGQQPPDQRLFLPEGTPRCPQHPALLGGRCKVCAYVFFPMQRYGCERCGAVDLEDFLIAGRGRLVASARVQFHADASRPAPFSIGVVATDEGPVVRSLLHPASEAELLPGDLVVAEPCAETRSGTASPTLCFGKED